MADEKNQDDAHENDCQLVFVASPCCGLIVACKKNSCSSYFLMFTQLFSKTKYWHIKWKDVEKLCF